MNVNSLKLSRRNSKTKEKKAEIKLKQGNKWGRLLTKDKAISGKIIKKTDDRKDTIDLRDIKKSNL